MMRITNNNQGILQLFQQTNRSRANSSKLFGSRASARRSGAGGRNTLEDFLSGHYKNSYGVEGMCVTNNPNARRIIKVSDEMKQRVYNSVKDAFYKYNGMSGDNEAEWEEMARAKNNYYKTLKVSDRAAAAWTLGRLEIGIARKVSGAVKEKVPGWTVGSPIPEGVLDEIFADDTIYQDSINALYSKGSDSLDVKI